MGPAAGAAGAAAQRAPERRSGARAEPPAQPFGDLDPAPELARREVTKPDGATAPVEAYTVLYDGAGEAPRPGITGKLVLDAVLDAHPRRRAAYVPRRPELAGFLRAVMRPGDVCL
ncbi:MAG: hypothetical protein ABR562_08655, partial [Thermoplasmatota archaeon]